MQLRQDDSSIKDEDEIYFYCLKHRHRILVASCFSFFFIIKFIHILIYWSSEREFSEARGFEFFGVDAKIFRNLDLNIISFNL